MPNFESPKFDVDVDEATRMAYAEAVNQREAGRPILADIYLQSRENQLAKMGVPPMVFREGVEKACAADMALQEQLESL